MNTVTILSIIGLLLAAYLLGSIPNAVWIGKRFHNIDIRQHGSKNPGATNAMRILGKRAGAAVFALDFLKGLGAVMLAYVMGFKSGSPSLYNMQMGLASAVVLGHIFPAFANFRGGKGVATLAGAMVGIVPLAALLCLATFAVVLLLSRYVSLSSMVAGIMLPIYTAFVLHIDYTPLIIFCCAISLLLLFTHRSNIKRLLSGSETKISHNK